MNTDDYEGHTEGLWTLCTWRDGRAEYDVVRDEGLDEDNNVIASIVGKWEERKSNMKLIAAAPDLLAEVKRFHQIQNDPVDVLGCWYWLSENYPDIAMEYQDGDGDNR